MLAIVVVVRQADRMVDTTGAVIAGVIVATQRCHHGGGCLRIGGTRLACGDFGTDWQKR